MLVTGIITRYLNLRLLVIRGSPNTYLTFNEESTEDYFRIADNTAECAGGFYAHRGFCAPLTAETQVSLYKG
jgi:hypothetical protein